MAVPEDELEALKAQMAALTARVYQLEQQAGAERAPVREPDSALTPTNLHPTVIGPPNFQAAFPPRSTDSAPVRAPSLLPSSGPHASLEKRIGQYWLNRIGIVAILIGVSYFLKYAFENNWIGPAGRIAIGLLGGIGLVLWSETFRRKGHQAFSWSLKAIGIGTLYLSLWGAFQIYHLIPASSAFAAMAVVTGSTIALALTQDAELLASFALIGGFATPVLLSTGENHEAVLFSYIGLLDLAILAMIAVTPWRRLLWGSFAGTVILYGGWYDSYYSIGQRPETVLFAALFAAIFAAAPLLTKHHRSTRFEGPSVTLTLLPLLNAAAFFLALYGMYESEKTALTWYALALAAVYLLISQGFTRRFDDRDAKTIRLLHVGIAVAFITIAIPLKLDANWITIGWLIESAILLWISVKMQADFLRYMAVAALALGIVRLLGYDTFHTETLLWNARFATYLVAIGVLGGIVQFGAAHASEEERPFLKVALVLLNVLALIALTREAADYFDRRSVAFYHFPLDGGSLAELQLAREFTYSVIWLIYGGVLMAVGFTKRSAFIRWQALVLMAVTIAKVFLYDVSALDKGYRILSFCALGGVLLAVSFIYQRDWLKLSDRSPEEHAKETS